MIAAASVQVPLWAVILIGLGGGLLGVLARIGYDRGVEFRTRQRWTRLLEGWRSCTAA